MFIYNDNNVPIHQKKKERKPCVGQIRSRPQSQWEKGKTDNRKQLGEALENGREGGEVSGCDMGQRVRSSALCGFVVIEFISYEASLAYREASRKWTLQGP